MGDQASSSAVVLGATEVAAMVAEVALGVSV